MKKRISILGCGWLGLPLGKHLVDKGFKVFGSIRSEDKIKQVEEQGINTIIIDLEKEIKKQVLSKFLNSDVLVICIPPRVGKSYSEQFSSIVHLLKEKRIQLQVIFISSTAIYDTCFDEITELNIHYSSSNRAKQLVEAENLFKENFPNNLVILRLAGLAGPERNPGKFLAGKMDVINPKAPVNFIHLKDCIQIIHKVIIESVHSEIFNVCAPLHPTREEFYTHHSELLDLDPPQFNVSKESIGKLISTNKLIDQLKYTFSYPNPMEFEF